MSARIQATKDGVQITLHPPDRDPVKLTLPVDQSVVFWQGWWAAMSTHFPTVAEPPETGPLALVMTTADFRAKAAARFDGVVHLMLQPKDRAGLGFEFQPEQARELARQMLEMADQLDAFSKPN